MKRFLMIVVAVLIGLVALWDINGAYDVDEQSGYKHYNVVDKIADFVVVAPTRYNFDNYVLQACVDYINDDTALDVPIIGALITAARWVTVPFVFAARFVLFSLNVIFDLISLVSTGKVLDEPLFNFDDGRFGNFVGGGHGGGGGSGR